MKAFKKLALLFLTVIAMGLLYPQHYSMPVEGATKLSYHPQSFWYYPWGISGTHKVVDIFAKQETPVRSATSGLVLHTGQLKLGGNIVLVLGPKWRLHYYAHLNEITTSNFSWVASGEQLGTVGTTGNAVGKPPHLHYALATPIPYFWRVDESKQGWMKMFYLNPIEYLEEL